MVKFLSKIYRKLLDFIAVVFLIVFVLIGAAFFNELNESLKVLGGVLGLIVGVLSEALVFPPLAILFSIDARLQKLEKLTDEVETLNKTVKEIRGNGKDDTPVFVKETAVHSPFLISDFAPEEFNNKDGWISKRIMKLINDGYRPSDAKAQAEAEYVIASIELHL